MRHAIKHLTILGALWGAASTMAQGAGKHVDSGIATTRQDKPGRHEEVLTEGWRFCRGCGATDSTLAGVDFDDSTWETVRVPHDFAIHGPTAGPGGDDSRILWQDEGWYRRPFRVSGGGGERRVYLDFDGVMAFPKVYVNGHLAGQWDYGYNSFRVDATPFINWNGENLLAVQADTRAHASRWYPGAGIYRKVTKVETAPVHVGHWGTFVRTPLVRPDLARVAIDTTLDNHGASQEVLTLTTSIFAPDGKATPIAKRKSVVIVPVQGSQTVSEAFDISSPQLWELSSPRLYRAVSVVEVNGDPVDVYETTFGIRSIEVTAHDGLHLNGRRVELRGVNLHHDHGPLGAAWHRRAMERQLEIMRGMGVNAIRTSHNPPAPELLDMADQMGFLVLDEAFDKWDATADKPANVDLGVYGERQIANFVHRDRNHPSVMMWSIGNEIVDVEIDPTGRGAAQVGMMADFVRKYDATRPVTMASHLPISLKTGLHAHLDVQSWNYGRKYIEARRHYPEAPMLISESASAVSSRGYYRWPAPERKDAFPLTPYLDSYDYYAVTWGDVPDIEFIGLDDHPYCAGEFVWSGFDYLGEPTPYAGQARISYFGIVDLVGLPKDRYYLYKSRWLPDEPTVHILPHWTWPEMSGRTLPVFVYTNGDSAELFLNGRSLGRRAKTLPPPMATLDLARDKPATASSEETNADHTAAKALDGNPDSRWCAANGSAPQFWQVDLGAPQPVRDIRVHFEKDLSNYQYVIAASTDGQTWQPIAKRTEFATAYGPDASHSVDIQTRYLRLTFTALRPGAWASLAGFEAYADAPGTPGTAAAAESLDRFRLRWSDVPYAPGELKAVAYKNGQRLGEARVVTAETPITLAMTPDRDVIKADGDDLSYLTLRALDNQGQANPRADSLVQLSLKGPGDLVGAGNGDQSDIGPILTDQVRLFQGQAVVIVRSRRLTAGEHGTIEITAKSEGLSPATVVVKTE